MTEILWHKFPDETIADRVFTTADKQKLERVFTEGWKNALALLKIKASPARMIAWHHERPYINWTAFITVVSSGIMAPQRTADGGHTLQLHYSLRGILRMMLAQWRFTGFMHRTLPAPSMAESLALGLVLQSLLMRLGPYAADLPRYLGDPGNAPAQIRKVLREIQTVQMRRTQISFVWNDVLPAGQSAPDADAPDYFWDDESPAPASSSNAPGHGQSVHPGIVTGIALVVDRNTNADFIAGIKAQYNAPVILVFAYAQPDTTLLFPYADALVFCEGGVLSHACTVARDMRIPAITAMGRAFMETADRQWFTLDGTAGRIAKLSCSSSG